MATTLEAVNEILEAIGEPPVTALDTGGTSIEAEAETILDREKKRIMEKGWFFNTDTNRELHIADKDLTVSGVSGTFSFEETITGGTSAETATFLYAPDSTSLFVHNASGAFTAAETLTGGTSGATATFSSSTDNPTSKIAIDSSWLSVRPANRFLTTKAAPEFTTRGNFLYVPDVYDRDDEDNAEVFNNSVYADIVVDPTFSDLADLWQDYAIKAASLAFQRFKQGDQTDNAYRQQELVVAKTRAVQLDKRQGKKTMQNKHWMRRAIGGRPHSIFTRVD